MSTKKLQYTVAEHFTSFLVSKGYIENEYCMNKKKLKDVFKDEYLPLYHVRMRPYDIILCLVINKFVKRQKKNKSETVFFRASNIKEIVSRHSSSRQDDLPPPPDTSVTSPVVKTYVSQQHAFQIRPKKTVATTSTECKLCSECFASEAQYQEHIALQSHKVREAYRTNRKSLCNKHSVTISFVSEDVTEDIIVREPAVGTVAVAVRNKGVEPFQLLKIFTLCELNEIERNFPTLPVHLKPGDSVVITLDYKFVNLGAYMYPLVLELLGSKGVSSYILKELVFRVQSELLDDLQASSPYKRPVKNVMKRSEAPILCGKHPPPIKNELTPARRLRQYDMPAALHRVINHGFKAFENMNRYDVQELKEIRSLLLGANIREKYTQFFRLLLYIEEHQMENDIHVYDRYDQTMKIAEAGSKLLSLEVPGLAEKRPSVLRNDRICVIIDGDNSVKYEGVVHCVREREVWLGFHNSLGDKFLPNMKFNVEFQYNRFGQRHQHRALEMIRNHSGSDHLFPCKHTTVPLKNVTITSWYNHHLMRNPEQRQAVQNIVSGTSYPAPYLIFGPPGTGKTVTVVEAVTQLYHLNEPNGHLLICAPSNAAADEVAKRLIISDKGSIPDKDILRLYASSYNPKNIPEQLKRCSNYASDVRDFYYPSKEIIMKYAVVVATLTTAGRLVTGGIPAGHFSHLFIDESGHAVEPEALIPVAGLFTSEKKKCKLLGQIVLAGDPKQLGPLLRSPVAIALGLGTSLLERLMNQCDLYKKDEGRKDYNPAVLTKLVQNFRSHKTILALPNSKFYDMELQACGNTELTSLACDWEGLPKKGFPLIFHGVKGKDQREGNSPSYFNIQEIEVVKRYVERLLADRFRGRKLSQRDIGIITPYRKQVEKIKRLFKKQKWDDITVGSVEEFQGQERLVIVISTVRSTMALLKEDYKLQLGFLKNPKRFNVALTRSKALLITVGDPDVLQCDVYWRELIVFCKDNGGYTGCPLKISAVSEQVEDVPFDLNSFLVDIAGSSNTEDGPRLHSDI